MHQTSSPSTTVRHQRHWLRQKTLDEVSANLILFWPQKKCQAKKGSRRIVSQGLAETTHQRCHVGWVEKIIIHSDLDSAWDN